MKRFLTMTTALALASAPSGVFAQEQGGIAFDSLAGSSGVSLNAGLDGASQARDNTLKVEIDLSGNGKRELKNIIPVFGELARYSGAQLSELERTLKGTEILGVPMQTVKAFKGENIVFMSNAADVTFLKSEGGKYVVVAYDENGNIMKNPTIFIGQPNGSVNCATTSGLKLAKHSPVQARFQVLMDVSGSMDDSMGDVIAASMNFINGVPRNAYCRVVAYNNSYSVVDANNGYGGWKLCEAKNWNLSRLKASGGTDSTSALVQSFADLKSQHPYFLPQNATMISGLVVITDGDGVNAGDIATIKNTKNDIPVFAYFEGHETSTSYEQWVERYLSASDGVDVVNAFQTFANTYLNARVVDPGVCGG
ncbi:MAG: hypothetical protein ABJF05_22315 [Paracoccaceae bacterium]